MYSSWNTIQSSNGLRLLSQGLSFTEYLRFRRLFWYQGNLKLATRYTTEHTTIFSQLMGCNNEGNGAIPTDLDLSCKRVYFFKVKEPSWSWSWQYVCLRRTQSSFNSFEISSPEVDFELGTQTPTPKKRILDFKMPRFSTYDPHRLDKHIKLY